MAKYVKEDKSKKIINAVLIERIFTLLSPDAKKSLSILSIPTLLSNSLAETLLIELGNSKKDSQKIIEEICSFPIWHYRTKILWVIDDDIRICALEKITEDLKIEMTEKVLHILKNKQSSLEDIPLMNLANYKIQILYLYPLQIEWKVLTFNSIRFLSD